MPAGERLSERETEGRRGEGRRGEGEGGEGLSVCCSPARLLSAAAHSVAPRPPDAVFLSPAADALLASIASFLPSRSFLSRCRLLRRRDGIPDWGVEKEGRGAARIPCETPLNLHTHTHACVRAL